ncbi:ABC transporter substrate-binding protein [Breznakiella homolactica]|uniref:ABC transporter substrate-binding protein n=1 Tax=Breznakiella homolactica TaxID=2798577 RepID=A0A7T8B8D7_9SPIR|nr:ABC transporter substrate-binding protein [Breznakiella homolactica]QQO08479.1 ABC transporter substrate-binding protein [Breznakiella homolactica]
MNSRNIFSLALIGILALSAFTGCGNSGSSSSGKKAGSNVTVQIFQSKVEIVDQLEAMAKEYTELTGVKVEVLGASGDNYMDTLVGKLTSGQGPTIFNVSPGGRLERLHSYLYDLSGQPYISDIADNQALVYDGKILGVPYSVEGYGLIYNKKLVDPSRMTDFNSFRSYAASLKASGVDPVQMSDKAYFLVGHILNVPFAMQDNYLDYIAKLNKGEVKMAATPEFQEWARFMEVIRANTANPMGVTYDDQIANFATGKTAMIHQGNWVWGMFADYGVTFDMSIAPLPLMGNDKLSVGMPNAWCINKDRSQEEITEALKFFEWFFTSERGHHYIANEFNFIPALKSVPVSGLDPLSTVVHEYTRSGKTLPWTYRDWPEGLINTHILPTAQKFFSDTSMTGQRFLEELDKAWVEGAAK